MKKSLLFFAMAPAVMTFTACGPKAGGPEKKENKNTPAIDVALLDTTFNPADNFFEYVNSKWLKANPIPASKSSWGAFNELDERSRLTLKEIQEKAAADKNVKAGSNAQLVGDFYSSGMDTVTIEKEGISPLKPMLAEIDTISSMNALSKLYARNAKYGISSPVAFYVDQDLQNTTRYISYLYQSGLGLPDRDYYFRTDKKSTQNREAYVKYIQQIFELAGNSSADAVTKAKSVMDIETALAKVSMTLVEQRDPYATYHLMKGDELQKLTPNFNWKAYFSELGIDVPAELVIGQPKFLTEWNKMLKKVSMDQWKDYYRFQLINSYADQLSSNFEKAKFDFYEKTLSGKLEMEERWKRVTDLSGYLLRDALGQEYVKVAFDEAAKEKALTLVNNLREALGERIKGLKWMGDSTKIKAQKKLDKMMVKIGYPDEWRNYDGLKMKKQSYVANVIAGVEYEFNRVLAKLGKEIDRKEWGMGPQTVNAYYNPLLNEIVFPAAILQPPFFDANADEAVNYGGIGMVIGHELTHGFDDQGRQFDENGNLTNWWAADDEKNFKELAARFVTQYNAYNPVDSIHINGELTLGENIADLGGMIISYAAFKKTKQGQGTEKIDGFTPDQRFFISFAQIWRTQYRDEALIQRLYTDPHSPPHYRVIGTLVNMPEFYTAFGVKDGNKLYVTDSLRSVMW